MNSAHQLKHTLKINAPLFMGELGRITAMLALALLVSMACAVQARAQGAVTLEGQIICCAECWAEADRTKVEFGTAEDLLKAQSCVESGDPTLLAVREQERFVLYQLEQGRFKLKAKNWLEFIGKKVSVTGEVRKKKDVNLFRVDELKVTEVSLAEREAAKVIGQPAELILKDLNGVEQSLGRLKGRIAILNFWATYCIPCRKEMPELAAIQNEYAAVGVQVVGASTDAIADRAKVMQFVRETKVNFPIWIGATTADMSRFGLGGALPGTVVISSDGRIAKVISGVINHSELKNQLNQMLSGNAVLPVVETSKATSESVSTKPGSNVSSVPS